MQLQHGTLCGVTDQLHTSSRARINTSPSSGDVGHFTLQACPTTVCIRSWSPVSPAEGNRPASDEDETNESDKTSLTTGREGDRIGRSPVGGQDLRSSVETDAWTKTNVLLQDKQREERMRGRKEGGEVKREADN
ncbi:hypothetical protein FQN60_004169 [Etheostoma spectabile]|uniref:Uncharacterized protein n=1 Tax=Etheostoma spectabile TaxID=54343 RepID=A0A5J5CYU5_9PERO|nr:hypothetical protein FQN60_004169 [Etheostoma spectabile]